MSARAGNRSDLANSLQRALLYLAAALFLASGLLLIGLIDGQPSIAWGFGIYSATCWVWITAGVVAWWRRPSNPLGALLILGAITLILGEAGNSTVPALAATGAIFATVILAITVHLLLAFPSGRVRGRWPRTIVGAGYVVAVLLQVPLYAFNVEAAGLPVFIADRPDLYAAGVRVQEIAGALVMAATAAVLASRLRRAKPYQRKVLIPLFGYGVLAVLYIPISTNVLTGWLGVDPVIAIVSQILVIAGIPVAFALAVLRGGFARTGELAELSTWLGASGEQAAQLSVPLASVLGDASLQLVFWVPERRRYVSSSGDEVQLPAGGTHRSWVAVELSGEPIGAIIYDSELIADPELVKAAGRVVALGIDRERLIAALRVTEQSLRRSRERIVETADDERRRIAKDLHDGLQVQLVLLALESQQFANDVDASPATRQRATELRRGVDAAAAELRTLVHAVMPSALVERGLAMATEDLVDRLPLKTALNIGDIGALPKPVESTAYFIVAEAVANVVKHAGASKVGVRLERDADLLTIEVVDDGVGGASLERGSGIRGLQDRTDVLGGHLRVTSPTNKGTTLLVQLPIHSEPQVAI